MIVDGLQSTWVTEGCRHNPKKETIVVQVRATRAFRAGEILLSPAGGTFSQRIGKDKDPKAINNPAQISSVRVSVYSSSSKRARDVGETVTTQWNIKPPMLQINSAKKRKLKEETIEELGKMAPYWAVLNASSGNPGNMTSVIWQLDDLGIANKERSTKAL